MLTLTTRRARTSGFHEYCSEDHMNNPNIQICLKADIFDRDHIAMLNHKALELATVIVETGLVSRLVEGKHPELSTRIKNAKEFEVMSLIAEIKGIAAEKKSALYTTAQAFASSDEKPPRKSVTFAGCAKE